VDIPFMDLLIGAIFCKPLKLSVGRCASVFWFWI